MKDNGCAYCMGGELLDRFGIYICDLSVSQLILFKEQSKPGRVIVAYKDHVSEIVNISEDERNKFMADVCRAANAVHKAFNPDKVNYGAYGDTGCHLHMHIVPRWTGDTNFMPVIGETRVISEHLEATYKKLYNALQEELKNA